MAVVSVPAIDLLPGDVVHKELCGWLPIKEVVPGQDYLTLILDHPDHGKPTERLVLGKQFLCVLLVLPYKKVAVQQ